MAFRNVYSKQLVSTAGASGLFETVAFVAPVGLTTIIRELTFNHYGGSDGDNTQLVLRTNSPPFSVVHRLLAIPWPGFAEVITLTEQRHTVMNPGDELVVTALSLIGSSWSLLASGYELTLP